MGKNIDKDKTIEALTCVYDKLSEIGEISAAAGFALSIDIVKAIRSYDTSPAVHGKWEENCLAGEVLAFNCSVCGEPITYFSKDRFKYCPNCGAKMDLE